MQGGNSEHFPLKYKRGLKYVLNKEVAGGGIGGERVQISS